MNSKLKSVVSVCFILLVSACANAEKLDERKWLNEYVEKYMSEVFGTVAPSLETYIKYQGQHSEDEHEEELRHCIANWSDNSETTLEEFANKVPSQCTDWLVARSGAARYSESLYYKKIRKEIPSFPIAHSISLIEEVRDGYNVIIDIMPSVNMALSVYPAIDDPGEYRIYITSLRKK